MASHAWRPRDRHPDPRGPRAGGHRAGDRRLADVARKIGYRLDPGAALRRNRKAENDRRVTIRPAPDTMSNVTGVLPVAHGVAVYAALRKHAETLRSQGDSRTISQIMADAFYIRLTGQDTAVGGIEIQLVMPERSLLRGGHEPATFPLRLHPRIPGEEAGE